MCSEVQVQKHDSVLEKETRERVMVIAACKNKGWTKTADGNQEPSVAIGNLLDLEVEKRGRSRVGDGRCDRSLVGRSLNK